MKHQDDIFLSKWLENSLSEEELKQFQSSKDYDMYVKIIEGTSKLKAPSYDLDDAFLQLKEKKNNRISTTPIKRKTNWLKYGVAAAIVLFVSIISYSNFFAKTTYESGFGEQLAFNLPDGSKVILNAKSNIKFDENNWSENRTLTLEGEAFFDVEKGNTFTVKTSQGNVTVLGTEFNVKSEDNFFEVACYEGKVKVEDINNNNTEYLTPTLGYRAISNNVTNSMHIEGTNPSWVHKQSSFKSVPIKYVFKALEKQYNITIKYSNFDDTISYTGSFPNNNQKIALETVLKSVNLNYTINGNSVILQD